MKKNGIWILSLVFCLLGCCLAPVSAQTRDRGIRKSAGVESVTAANPVVRFNTSQGNVDVELFPSKAPLTVANFLGYVDRNDYNGSFIHRLAPSFVLQGGGFKYDGQNIFTIATQPPVMNEFNLSNKRGTLAMAKVSGDPNSATSQWFFNLEDNSTNLDSQNGGYTVFGRIANSNSQTVLNQIAALQVQNFGSPFDQLPVVNYTSNQPLLVSNLVNLTSITRITQNTPTGSNIAVEGAGGDATVTFSAVAAAGMTSFTPISPPSAAGTAPNGYFILSNGPAVDISTTATVVPPIVTCFTVSSVTNAATFAGIRILHGEAGVLVDRTILAPDSPAPDFAMKRVCARTVTLSPFITAINTAVTAAGADISGRVTMLGGRGVRNATVMLTDQQGVTRIATTDPRGGYRFDDVETGHSYIIGAVSPRFTFASRVIVVTDALIGVDLIAEP